MKEEMLIDEHEQLHNRAKKRKEVEMWSCGGGVGWGKEVEVGVEEGRGGNERNGTLSRLAI